MKKDAPPGPMGSPPSTQRQNKPVFEPKFVETGNLTHFLHTGSYVDTSCYVDTANNMPLIAFQSTGSYTSSSDPYVAMMNDPNFINLTPSEVDKLLAWLASAALVAGGVAILVVSGGQAAGAIAPTILFVSKVGAGGFLAGGMSGAMHVMKSKEFKLSEWATSVGVGFATGAAGATAGAVVNMYAIKQGLDAILTNVLTVQSAGLAGRSVANLAAGCPLYEGMLETIGTACLSSAMMTQVSEMLAKVDYNSFGHVGIMAAHAGAQLAGSVISHGASALINKHFDMDSLILGGIIACVTGLVSGSIAADSLKQEAAVRDILSGIRNRAMGAPLELLRTMAEDPTNGVTKPLDIVSIDDWRPGSSYNPSRLQIVLGDGHAFGVDGSGQLIKMPSSDQACLARAFLASRDGVEPTKSQVESLLGRAADRMESKLVDIWSSSFKNFREARMYAGVTLSDERVLTDDEVKAAQDAGYSVVQHTNDTTHCPHKIGVSWKKHILKHYDGSKGQDELTECVMVGLEPTHRIDLHLCKGKHYVGAHVVKVLSDEDGVPNFEMINGKPVTYVVPSCGVHNSVQRHEQHGFRNLARTSQLVPVDGCDCGHDNLTTNNPAVNTFEGKPNNIGPKLNVEAPSCMVS